METKKNMFNFYKARLAHECGEVCEQVRFNAIEFLCQFPDIDPVEMAAHLKQEGHGIVFDDTSISKAENKRKERAVERRFNELFNGDKSVDDIIGTAIEKSMNQKSVQEINKDFIKE